MAKKKNYIRTLYSSSSFKKKSIYNLFMTICLTLISGKRLHHRFYLVNSLRLCTYFANKKPKENVLIYCLKMKAG